MVNRRNSINGKLYRDDPTIFAWDLMYAPAHGGCCIMSVKAYLNEGCPAHVGTSVCMGSRFAALHTLCASVHGRHGWGAGPHKECPAGMSPAVTASLTRSPLPQSWCPAARSALKRCRCGWQTGCLLHVYPPHTNLLSGLTDAHTWPFKLRLGLWACRHCQASIIAHTAATRPAARGDAAAQPNPAEKCLTPRLQQKSRKHLIIVSRPKLMS